MSAHFSYPPYQMKAAAAAHYCGMSRSQFYLAVDKGELPEGKKKIGGTYWLRRELEASMDGNVAATHDFSAPI